MMKKMNTFAAALALAACALFPASAGAQTVYKCAGGYSQQPCPGGQAMTVADPRSESQKAEAGAATRRDARLADALEKERLKQEAQPAASYVPPPQMPPAVIEDKPQAKGKPRKPELFTAAVPGAKAAKKAAKSKKPKKKAKDHKAA